jgi:hypothetical protein
MDKQIYYPVFTRGTKAINQREVIKEEFIDFKNLDLKNRCLTNRSETCELLKLTVVHFGVGPERKNYLLWYWC